MLVVPTASYVPPFPWVLFGIPVVGILLGYLLLLGLRHAHTVEQKARLAAQTQDLQGPASIAPDAPGAQDPRELTRMPTTPAQRRALLEMQIPALHAQRWAVRADQLATQLEQERQRPDVDPHRITALELQIDAHRLDHDNVEATRVLLLGPEA